MQKAKFYLFSLYVTTLLITIVVKYGKVQTKYGQIHVFNEKDKIRQNTKKYPVTYILA